MEIEELVQKQREFFLTGKTLSYSFRFEMLSKLEEALKKNEALIEEALQKDLHKSAFESYMCEVGLSLSEVTYLKKHLKKWMKPQRVHTPMSQYRAKSFTIAEPYGVSLVLSPWNYPFMLSIEPVAGSIAAGNTVVLKPSAYSPATSAILKKILNEIYPEEYVAVVEGGREANTALLDQRFDYIFFTGSVTVGKLVMEKASRNLTPISLELGGKSPTIVDKTADISLAAKRIVFGKFLNSGQTCVAPDYVLVQESVHDAFVKEVLHWIDAMYGKEALKNPDYPRIVNKKHFDRISGLIDPKKVVRGGKKNEETLQIEPTVLDRVTLDDSVMGEEIFGPILPILIYKDREEMVSIIRHFEKPLALYLFTNDKELKEYVLTHISFGGGCLNDTIVHLATSEMGFGGVGYSGMGSYHGERSFETFSHRKSILDKKLSPDLNIRYQPYDKKKEKWLRKFLK